MWMYFYQITTNPLDEKAWHNPLFPLTTKQILMPSCRYHHTCLPRFGKSAEIMGPLCTENDAMVQWW